MSIEASKSTKVDYSAYIIDSSNQIKEIRKGGRLNQSVILTFEDNSEWVFLNNKGKDRFCGFLYLQGALKAANLSDRIVAAENKMAFHNREVIYLSKYCGENRPDVFECFSEVAELKSVGFEDTIGAANLRKYDGKICVFDTEKGSFAPSVREKIDAFTIVHDSIRATLEEQPSV